MMGSDLTDAEKIESYKKFADLFASTAFRRLEFIDISNVIDKPITSSEGQEMTKKFTEDLQKYPLLFRLPFPNCLFKYRLPRPEDFYYNVRVIEVQHEEKIVLTMIIKPPFMSIDIPDGLFFRIVYNPIGDNRESYFNIGEIKEGNLIETPDSEKFSAVALTLPVLRAIVMMNCRNVKLVDEPQGGLKRMLNKHTRKKKIIYKVLTVDILRPKTKSDHESIETGIKKSLHVCRGHLRTYSEDKPLFGKLTGTYFIPAHMRGTSDVGVVDKDYKFVKNP